MKSFTKQRRELSGPWLLVGMTSAAMASASAPFLPLKRTGTSEEIAQAIVFIGSDAASFITGTIVGVDGGMLAS